MTTEKDNNKTTALPEDKKDRMAELRKMMVWSELLKPKFDEGQE